MNLILKTDHGSTDCSSLMVQAMVNTHTFYMFGLLASFIIKLYQLADLLFSVTTKFLADHVESNTLS